MPSIPSTVGATSILVPEIKYDLKRDILDKIERTKATGKKHFIIVVAEGVGGVSELSKEIEELTGIETRATILGHVQRGGSPTLRDRLFASLMGHEAVKLLSQGIGNRVIAYRQEKIVNYDIYEALQMVKPFDVDAYNIANEISI